MSAVSVEGHGFDPLTSHTLKLAVTASLQISQYLDNKTDEWLAV